MQNKLVHEQFADVCAISVSLCRQYVNGTDVVFSSADLLLIAAVFMEQSCFCGFVCILSSHVCQPD